LLGDKHSDTYSCNDKSNNAQFECGEKTLVTSKEIHPRWLIDMIFQNLNTIHILAQLRAHIIRDLSLRRKTLLS